MKNSLLLNLYFFVLFIYNAASCSLLTVTDWAPWYYSSIPVALSIIVAITYNVNLFDRKLLTMLAILAIWNGAQYFFNHVSPSPYGFMLLVIAWVAYSVFNNELSDRFVSLTYKLSIVSLIVWLLCLLAPTTMHSIGANYGIDTMDASYSFLFFNINKGESLRNCGFCWEPGRYSCILMMALYFHYIKYGLANRNWKFYVLLFSLLSTVSTTGFIALFVFAIYHVLKRRILNPFYIASLIAIFLYVWNLPFMSEKIHIFGLEEGHFEQSVSNMEWASSHGATQQVYCPQRFDGMAFQWMNVTHMNPIIGDSHNFTRFYINEVLGYNVVASEGILFMILCYGLIIGILCYFFMIKSSFFWGRRFGGNYIWLFFILFMVMNFSYNFWEFPLYTTIWLWAYFEGGKVAFKTT